MATQLHWQGSDVDMTAVQGHVSELWKELTSSREVAGLVRAHVLNLVAYAGSREAAERVMAMLQRLADRQPSRAVVLIADRLVPQSSVDAEASVQCRPAPGGSHALCVEQISITAHGRAADHLASVVTPLLLPELPTYLWWPGQPPFGHRSFHRLLTMAHRLLVDSAEFTSPGDGLANLARISTGHTAVQDFHWSRLAVWREMIAQFFDGANWLPYTRSIRSIRLELGAGGSAARSTATVLLLLGWMATQLGWEPETTMDAAAAQDIDLAVMQRERLIPVEIRFRDHGEKAQARPMVLELVSQPFDQPPARFTIQRSDDLEHAHVATVVHDGPEIERVVPIEMKSDVDLLADELGQARQDELYQKVVCMASRLAGRELWIPA